LSCTDAAGQGKPCVLTKGASVSVTASAGEPAPTREAFKAALTQHGIACTPSGNDDIRLIGKQNKSQRHVVEFKCPEQPKGLVALRDTSGRQTFPPISSAKMGAVQADATVSRTEFPFLRLSLQRRRPLRRCSTAVLVGGFAPAMMSKSPGSTTRFICAFQNHSERWSRWNTTVRASPGCRVTRWTL
jgi:hypothetical protein